MFLGDWPVICPTFRDLVSVLLLREAYPRWSAVSAAEDLDRAWTRTEVVLRIDAELPRGLLSRYWNRLPVDVAQEGVALCSRTEDPVLRSLGRVAAKRALILCHMLTIHGREYRQCLPAPAA